MLCYEHCFFYSAIEHRSCQCMSSEDSLLSDNATMLRDTTKETPKFRAFSRRISQGRPGCNPKAVHKGHGDTGTQFHGEILVFVFLPVPHHRLSLMSGHVLATIPAD
jgi:hypothetical protein